jgi:hypothetical protein
MSVKIMSRVWSETALRENDLLVLLALADWANDLGQCWPSYPRIAEKTRIDLRTAKAIVARLLQTGYLTLQRGGGRGNPNIYTVHVPPIHPPRPLDITETVAQHHPLPAENGGDTNTQTVNREPPNGGVGNNKRWRAHARTTLHPLLTVIKEPSLEPRDFSFSQNGKGEANHHSPPPVPRPPLPTLPEPVQINQARTRLRPEDFHDCATPGCIVQTTTTYCYDHGDPISRYTKPKRRSR